MKLLHLLLVILLIVLFYLVFFHAKTEDFQTLGYFVLKWDPPASNGGDANCCSYDWQICDQSDTSCKSPVDFGTVTTNSATTSKVGWGQKYVAMVRSINAAGKSDWATGTLTAGGAPLASPLIGDTIDNSSGTYPVITKPLLITSKQITVTVNAPGLTFDSNAGMIANLTMTQSRSGVVIKTFTQKMDYQGNRSNLAYFTTVITSGVNIQNNDVFNAYAYATYSSGAPYGDIQGAITVTMKTASAPTNISWTYVPPKSCVSSADCGQADAVCVGGVCMSQYAFLVQNFTANGAVGKSDGWSICWTGALGKTFDYKITTSGGTTVVAQGTATVGFTPWGYYGYATAGTISSDQDYEATITEQGTNKSNVIQFIKPTFVQPTFPLMQGYIYVQQGAVIVTGRTDIQPQRVDITFSLDGWKSWNRFARTSTVCEECNGSPPGYGGIGEAPVAIVNGNTINISINMYASTGVVTNLQYTWVVSGAT